MAARVPICSFLRPLAPPRPATVRHFLRRLESTQAQVTVDRNLIASRTASPSYPPPSLKSLPRPKESHASHRTSQPTKVRNYPDRQWKSPHEVQLLPEAESAPNLPYFVTRTPSKELPIYHLRKRGGNLRQTRVKKIDGSIEALRDALEKVLRVRSGQCEVNQTTKHVIIKGFHKPKIEAFLKARRF